MATRRNATGIILRRTDFGEADRVLVIITKELGKVTAIAKGSRKLQSKLAGGIEFLSISEIGLLPGKSMYTLNSARNKTSFSNISKNLTTLNHVYELLKLVSSKTENQEGAELFFVLEQALAALNEGVAIDLVKTWFYMQFLTYFGQQLNLTHDVNGVELGADLTYALQPSQGALVPSESEHAYFSAVNIKALRLMQQYDPRQLNQIKGVQQAISSVTASFEDFAKYQIN